MKLRAAVVATESTAPGLASRGGIRTHAEKLQSPSLFTHASGTCDVSSKKPGNKRHDNQCANHPIEIQPENTEILEASEGLAGIADLLGPSLSDVEEAEDQQADDENQRGHECFVLD